MERKILIVDDERPILEALRRLFAASGYTVFFTTSGEQALEIMEREHIRVFFVDLRMPVMNGVELCRRIKEQDKTTYVYAVSAYTAALSRNQFHELGFQGWFKKPFKHEKLLEMCHDAFDKIEQEGRGET